MTSPAVPEQVAVLARVIDDRRGLFEQLNGGRTLGEYLDVPRPREDEELLTEPLLASILERVLGFPADAYFPQLGRSGLKPDFTPVDLVAHHFVLDAKSSTQRLEAHERQIRQYIDQRHLDYGVLFNLEELRVYRRDAYGHDPDLSFNVRRLWEVARGEALATEEIERFVRFCGLFGHRAMGVDEKIQLVAESEPWRQRAGAGEHLEIDLEFLVSQLRSLSRVLADDAAAQHERLLADLELNPERERRLRLELETLAREIEPGVAGGDLPASVAAYRDAAGVARRAWAQYLMRVSQLTLTRILLYRSWEDAGFVEDCLYDGGFGLVYEQMDRNLRRVLDEAFNRGRERYRWLFGDDNNYDWYRPRDEALADVLYALVPIPLARLGADVLGGLYESYVDDIDRDRLGQFYTPRSVVRFMLDRAGFAGPEGVFRLEGDARRERRVFDFATGSGGFLVEAARRVIDDGGLDMDDPRELREGLRAIVRGFHGCEISPFPYYLTEVNLLLQVSRLLGRLREVGEEPGRFTLGVVHTDSLGARPGPDESLHGIEPGHRRDAALLASDERYGLVPLDRQKEPRFAEIREDEAFDLVVGNPPYVAEAGNKVLFDRLRALPGWSTLYRGKGDYLYYFLILAAEKVAPGGRLCVITPAGWMNAGNAAWLRERLASQLRIDELFLFGSMRLFATEHEERGVRAGAAPPMVESSILVATKAPASATHRVRVIVLEDEAAAARALTDDPAVRTPPREGLLNAMSARASGRPGRRNGLLVHDVAQRDLRSEQPWPVKHATGDVATAVVAVLERGLRRVSAPVERLAERWVAASGIETGADALTPRVLKRLDDRTKEALNASGLAQGDPIMQLPAGREQSSPWREHPELLARAPEAAAVLYGAIDASDYTSLVWIGRDDDAPPDVVEALEPWRDVLQTRAEFKRNASRRWFETAWPRDRTALTGPKVIALHRTDRGRFAVDETGMWQAAKNATTVTPRADGLSVAFLCGVLNSELLDLWYAKRGRHPRDIWRDYEPKPMNAMPYRHVPVPDGWRPSDHVTELAAALAAGDVANALRLGNGSRARVGTPAGDADAKWAIEHLVRAVAENRRRLLPYRAVAPDLRRAVKNPWRTHGVAVDPGALILSLSSDEVRSVRVEPSLRVTIATDGVLGRRSVDADALRFLHARKETARVEGPADRLSLLDETLPDHTRLIGDDLRSARTPTSLAEFRKAVRDLEDEIQDLLHQGRVLVEIVERLVCALYGVSEGLTERIVESAIARAGSGAGEDT